MHSAGRTKYLLSTHTRLKLLHWLPAFIIQAPRLMLISTLITNIYSHICQLSHEGLSVICEGVGAVPRAKVMSQAMVKVAQKEKEFQRALIMLEREKTPNKNWREAAW